MDDYFAFAECRVCGAKHRMAMPSHTTGHEVVEVKTVKGKTVEVEWECRSHRFAHQDD